MQHGPGIGLQYKGRIAYSCHAPTWAGLPPCTVYVCTVLDRIPDRSTNGGREIQSRYSILLHMLLAACSTLAIAHQLLYTSQTGGKKRISVAPTTYSQANVEKRPPPPPSDLSPPAHSLRNPLLLRL